MVKGALREPMKGSPVNNSSVITAADVRGSRSARELGIGWEAEVHCCNRKVLPLPIPIPKVSNPAAVKTLMRGRFIALRALCLFSTILAIKV